MTEPAGRLGDDDYARLDRQLQPVDSQLATRYPGDAGVRHGLEQLKDPLDGLHATRVPGAAQIVPGIRRHESSLAEVSVLIFRCTESIAAPR